MIETLTLGNESLRIWILPELGGKIISFFLKPAAFELAAQPTHGGYKKACMYDSFSHYDLSGMDDAFPNIDPERIDFEGRTIRYPDHGEISERAQEGLCGIDYPTQKVKCRIRYDATVLPYIGTWITCGAFMKDYNLALEMTDGYYDKVSRALRNGKIRILSPGEEAAYDTVISLEEDKGKLL